MSFIREFDKKKCKQVKENKLWEKLFSDIKDGIVYPAIRKERLDFYYAGGVLFRFEGKSYKFNTEYFKYIKELDPDLNILPYAGIKGSYKSVDTLEREIGKKNYFYNNYDKLKEGIELKFSSKKNSKSVECYLDLEDDKENMDKERKFLAQLYSYTYRKQDETTPKVIVLDIEIRANLEDGENGKKCDMLLFNMESNELMFVEAKLSGNPEVKSNSNEVKVFQQMDNYNNWFENAGDDFTKQYKKYIKIISKGLNLFPYKINEDKLDTLKMHEKVKLFIANGDSDFQIKHLGKIYDRLGSENVCYFDRSENENITPEAIWNR